VESFIVTEAVTLLMVDSRLKLWSSAACILALFAIFSSNAAAYGSSVEDLVGAFSIQKTIKIGSSSECFDGANSAPDPLDPQSIAPVEDSLPPRLAAFSIEPKEAKSGMPIQSINLTAHIIDDQSGLSSGDKANLSIAHFQSTSGKQTADAIFHPDNLTSGSILDGIYSTKIFLPPNSEPGVWQLNNFTLVDGQGNGRVLSKDNLAILGFPVQFLVK
jgi:hypothetical protein